MRTSFGVFVQGLPIRHPMAIAIGEFTVRIYAVADIHGKPERISRIRKYVRERNPDVLAAAGDITQYRHARRVLSQLADLPIPVLAVRGNSDRAYVENLFLRLANVSPLHLEPIHVKDTRFVGVSGTALLPFRSRIRYRERRLFSRLAPLVDESTVLVTHPPPWGTLDEVLDLIHAGCHRLKQLISCRRPALLLCGHIHEGAGWQTVVNTVVVNCTMGKNGGGAVIEMDNGRVKQVEML